MTEEIITIDELAQRWKVAKSWVYTRTRESGPGSIPRIKLGKYLRFDWSQVQDWAREQSENQNG